MEWSLDSQFVDLPSFTVINRYTPEVAFNKDREGNHLVLKTSGLKIDFKHNGRPFSKENLEITFPFAGGITSWFPGKRDPGNLKGTARTLDFCDGISVRTRDGSKREKLDLGRGLLSRSGWSLIDDSFNILIKPLPGGRHWIEERSKKHRKDFYFLAYGHDYREALRDAAGIFGVQSLPPRYAFGYWWSRYWAYTDRELENLASDFETHGVPLDVLVVDIDWHLGGWTGYTWNRDLFPDPEEFLKWARSKGLKVTLNLHPADGVGKHEEMFDEMAGALGMDPEKTSRIPFDCTDQHFIEAYFKYLHHPNEKMGIDFWWMDWQQGKSSRIEDLDPLPWLNILHWEDQEAGKTGKRPLNFSRYGGLGSGRYPVGFSGDTFASWDSLAFQPYFTASAANVLYGYWSHDIGGHLPGPVNPELYTRWVQFGILSPIFRSHTTKHPQAERRFWEYPEPYSSIMMEAAKRRYEMIPYIYTEARKTMDSGISICRPLYYDWPEEEGAYKAFSQYSLGDELLVVPVTVPRDDSTDMAEITLWLPPGKWFDTASGQRLQGGRSIKKKYLLEEIPVFVRPGSVIPGQRGSLRLKDKSYRNLILTVWPGKEGSYSLYEDDGLSSLYLEGEEAWIDFSSKIKESVQVIEVHPIRGGFKGLVRKKSLEIRLPSTLPPLKIKAGGEELAWSLRLRDRGWSYLGETAASVIRIPDVDMGRGITIEIERNRALPEECVFGLAGLMRRLWLIHHYCNLSYDVRQVHPRQTMPAAAAQTGNRISRDPALIDRELLRLKAMLEEMPPLLNAMLKRVADLYPGHPEKQGYLAKAGRILRVTKREYNEMLNTLKDD